MANTNRTTEPLASLMTVDPPTCIAAILSLILMCGGCVPESENIRLMNPKPYGQPNANAPEKLSQFAFLIGSWRCETRVKGPDGTFETHQAVWTARYIMDGYVIADEYRETTPDGQLVRLGATYRSYNSRHDEWVMKWHDALASTWIDLGPAELGGVQADGTSIAFKHKVPPDGLLRCTFSDISENHFTWLGEFSSDEGGTWEDVMVIQAYRITE